DSVWRGKARTRHGRARSGGPEVLEKGGRQPGRLPRLCSSRARNGSRPFSTRPAVSAAKATGGVVPRMAGPSTTPFVLAAFVTKTGFACGGWVVDVSGRVPAAHPPSNRTGG